MIFRAYAFANVLNNMWTTLLRSPSVNKDWNINLYDKLQLIKLQDLSKHPYETTSNTHYTNNFFHHNSNSIAISFCSFKAWWRGRNKILHMTWQLCCHDMCQYLQWSNTDGKLQQSEFLIEFESWWKNLVKQFPGKYTTMGNHTILQKAERNGSHLTEIFFHIHIANICILVCISITSVPNHAKGSSGSLPS